MIPRYTTHQLKFMATQSVCLHEDVDKLEAELELLKARLVELGKPENAYDDADVFAYVAREKCQEVIDRLIESFLEPNNYGILQHLSRSPCW